MSRDEGQSESRSVHSQTVRVPVGQTMIDGDLSLPERSLGMVLFAHGSGSGRHSPRNRFVADGLNRAGLGTLLIDLLTEEEERVDLVTRQLRFDIELLSQRLLAAIDWLEADAQTGDLPVGLFGASTGAAAALKAAERQASRVKAVVSRGGRPDLAGDALPGVRAPTQLIVGGADEQVIDFNEQAMAKLSCPVELVIVPGATHLFEEPGKLERVVELARDWFQHHLSVS